MDKKNARLEQMNRVAIVVGLLTVLLGTVGCGGNNAGSKEVVAGGSTFVEPMMREWAAIYDKEKGIKIDYKGGGSGKGIQQMIEKTYAFGCTDAPMNLDEIKMAQDK